MNHGVWVFPVPFKRKPFGVLGFFLNFIYLFLAALGLRCCARAFFSCGEQGPLFIAVRGPLTVTASLVAEHRLQTRRLSNCGSRAQLLRGMWDLPRPGLEPVFPALAGRFSTNVPPRKPKPFGFKHTLKRWSFWFPSLWTVTHVLPRSSWSCHCPFGRWLTWVIEAGPTQGCQAGFGVGLAEGGSLAF